MSEPSNVQLHPQAAAEIDEADDWYTELSIQVAANFRATVYVALQRIANEPLSFPIVDDPFRRCVLRGFPYVIFFDYTDSTAKVVAVATLAAIRVIGETE